ncbi:hypothetical protein [Leuconostoc mesenteroides]|uniref:hypothetical protein n=1 Tax=Leuconostoc mesenteroides TaxID=1245 RepID=UPI000C99B7BC|nr:hypothetical protein [Leuconostoc mesenteroides]PND40746.1 hypothetical protein B0W51_09090 [Leuconostoc mesenteroides]USI46689.1 hypothetical protein M0D19_04780 [Leuconostoc mesenteroides]UVV93469.1 hypothetical protein NX809_04795 [Leuconostoc mesenteroides]
MSKSKIVKANKKIEEKVVKTYKTIENGAVEGFGNISDKFVDKYLAKDGESAQDAKKRIEAEQNQREKTNIDMINKHR